MRDIGEPGSGVRRVAVGPLVYGRQCQCSEVRDVGLTKSEGLQAPLASWQSLLLTAAHLEMGNRREMWLDDPTLIAGLCASA